MQNPHGRIISVHPDQVVVEVDTESVCERCASGKGCGAGLLGGAAGTQRITASLPAGLEVADGDLVSIVLEPRNLLRAAVIVYGYPLAGAVAGAIAASFAGLGDVAAAVAALSGIATGVLSASRRLRNVRCLREFTPAIVERLSAASQLAEPIDTSLLDH